MGGNEIMPIIEPLPEDEIEEKGFGKILTRCEEVGAPDALFVRILARAPGYTKALHDAMHMSHAEGGVDHKLKEIIRVQLARKAEDTYFANLRSGKAMREGLTEERIEAGCGDFENDASFTPAEKWALRYAFTMYREPGKLNKEFYDEGKKHFSEAQIMELGGFIALHYGMQVFMRTLKAFPMNGPDGNSISQGESEKIYGAKVVQ
jgi:alkylhydroperoxidase family enzyme